MPWVLLNRGWDGRGGRAERYRREKSGCGSIDEGYGEVSGFDKSSTDLTSSRTRTKAANFDASPIHVHIHAFSRRSNFDPFIIRQSAPLHGTGGAAMALAARARPHLLTGLLLLAGGNPLAVGQACLPHSWPANASRIQCSMDMGENGSAAALGSADGCAMACCTNPRCAVWQW